jgi:acyl carrier protein
VTTAEIEDLIVELLAADQGRPVDELRHEIQAGGEHLPVDSVMMVEILGRVEERCGVQLPLTASTARCLGSVRDFAALIDRLRRIAERVPGREGA